MHAVPYIFGTISVMKLKIIDHLKLSVLSVSMETDSHRYLILHQHVHVCTRTCTHTSCMRVRCGPKDICNYKGWYVATHFINWPTSVRTNSHTVVANPVEK